MSSFDLPKVYDPKTTDSKWMDFWEKGNFFIADAHSKKPSFSIVIPPPNVTGVLHMGHALVNTLQDVLIRFKRMAGFETLWVPGTDHAGIATQTVVERHLLQTEGKRRKDYTREEFIHHIWQWKEKSEKTILSQLKSLGCSCDFSRLRFTMDENCNLAVRTVFAKMFKEGLIYRGNYLVNWDPVTETALADDEVEYEERDSYLWTFRYHLAKDAGHILIATTRPETMLGDTAIAVSPKDERYRHLIGKKVNLPIMQREIPIIADHHVDPEFGTGIVKVTPAHDPNDYKMGLDHGLEFINILTPNGCINENGGPFKGMTRERAREEVVSHMKKLGLLEKVERHRLRVGVSYRSKAIIEPYLSKQWFLKMEGFSKNLKEAVEKNKVKILPKSWETTYFHWINNLRDWCISRQLWWGHQIPVWYRKDNPDEMLCQDGLDLPLEVQNDPDSWRQDPDVLDTWFSSALWPFSALGWPHDTPELKKFYPLSTLITGHDILFFWVARMIMMGEYVLGELPFPETFLHGLIYGKSYWRRNQDESIRYITGEEKKEYDLGKSLPSDVESKWEKLSKSKGNVIDPLEMIQDYGTDAVRMSLCASANQSPQIDLDRRRFEEFKNFANKIWNGARFIFLNLEDLELDELSKGIDEERLSLEDRWILSSINRLNQDTRKALEEYRFEHAAKSVYDFFWKEFCAYYVEIVKPVLFGKAKGPKDKINKQKLLAIILCNMVRLLHPMAPFITEELFQLLKKRFANLDVDHMADPYTKDMAFALSRDACAVAPFPSLVRSQDIHPEIEERFSFIEKIIYAVRSIRAELKIPPSLSTDILLLGEYNEDVEIIRPLVKAHRIIPVDRLPESGLVSTAMAGNLLIAIPMPIELAQQEAKRLVKERQKSVQTIEKCHTLLNNPEFLEKANPELVSKQKKALEQAELELRTILEKLARVES